jgi:hypothetical protein
MSKWKSIKSAPKDKEILLCVAGYPWAMVGIWNEPSKKWCYAQLQLDMYDGKWCDTSYQSDYESPKDSKGRLNVTHWMLLPKIPNEDKA